MYPQITASSIRKASTLPCSDDAWYPVKHEIQPQYLEDHPGIGAVFGKVDWIDEKSNLITYKRFPFMDVFDVKNRTEYEWLGHFIKFGNCLCHPCSLIRKVCYDEVGWLSSSFANLPDFDLWIRFCLKYDIHIMDQRLIRFRRLNEEKNANGDNITNRVRNRFEFKQILDHYLKIQDPKELKLIFSNAAKYGKASKEIIPYFLGRIAINSGVDFLQFWGLEKIYALLENEITAQKLEIFCGFTQRDFIKLTGDCDFFKITFFPIQTVIFHKSRFRVFLSASKKYLKNVLSIIRT